MKSLFFTLAVLGTAVNGSQGLSDFERAETKVPRAHLMGNGVKHMYEQMNTALHSTSGLSTRPCAEWSFDDLTNILELVFTMRNPDFEKIYRKTDDNRRLQANGVYSETFEDLKAVWEQEAGVLAENPSLHDVSRDGRCHDAVMWFTHHLTADRKEELISSGDFTLPLMPDHLDLPHSKSHHEKSANRSAVDLVFESYATSTSCAMCHASGSVVSTNTESTSWPASLSYTGTGYGNFPFWDNTGPGCSYCDGAIAPSSDIEVHYDSTINSEILMHSSCSDMSWTGDANAPNSSPCNHIFNSSLGAFIYTPVSAMSKEADGEFCCRSYSASDSSFPGAVPQDWARSMTYWGTNTGFHGDYYTGEIKIYWTTVTGVDFWYYEQADGTPLEQGEGCYFPGVKNKTEACLNNLPIMLWHDYDPASVDWVNGEEQDSSWFEVPEICQTTTVSCSAPGSSSGSYNPVLSHAARQAGVRV